jgi:ribonuclease VapC
LIVDTSALVAISRKEAGFTQLLDALMKGEPVLPAPVLLEYQRVTALSGNRRDPDADALISGLVDEGAIIASFTAEDAAEAASANALHGTGNGRGGRLNMLDLMVYAVAKRMDLPILCTGRDFSSTDAKIHPASRTQ